MTIFALENIKSDGIQMIQTDEGKKNSVSNEDKKYCEMCGCQMWVMHVVNVMNYTCGYFTNSALSYELL